MGSAIQGNIIYISILLLFYYREGFYRRMGGGNVVIIIHRKRSWRRMIIICDYYSHKPMSKKQKPMVRWRLRNGREGGEVQENSRANRMKLKREEASERSS